MRTVFGIVLLENTQSFLDTVDAHLQLGAIFVESLSLSAVSSSFFAVASDISLSQYAFCEASSSASASNVAIMSVINPFTLAKGSASPELRRMAEDIREANCASAGELDFRARSLTKRTASAFARSAPDETCKNETWLK